MGIKLGILVRADRFASRGICDQKVFATCRNNDSSWLLDSSTHTSKLRLPTKAETGHVRNVANFATLITFCTSYDATDPTGLSIFEFR